MRNTEERSIYDKVGGRHGVLFLSRGGGIYQYYVLAKVRWLC